MTRDVASRFNHKMGETFVLPQDKIQENSQLVPGTDGNKMSKSRNNFINIFLTEKELKKQVMAIVSDSKGLEESKDPDTCNIFALYKLLASENEINEMRTNYINGGYGYGHAKLALYDLILVKFAKEREIYFELMANPAKIDEILAIGAEKARVVAQGVLQRVRAKVGYGVKSEVIQ
jgi:tryptophanyl-tRNA synthetase